MGYKQTCDEMRANGWLSHVLAAPNLSGGKPTSPKLLAALKATKTYRAFVDRRPAPPFPEAATSARLRYVDGEGEHDHPVAVDDASGLIMRIYRKTGQRLVGFISDLPPVALEREASSAEAARKSLDDFNQREPSEQNQDTPSSLIPYLRKVEASEFYGLIRGAFEQSWEADWHLVQCNLGKEGGYEEEIAITVAAANQFEVGRRYRDWTRFPARIRAAATALRDCEQFGSFLITCREGNLTIERLENASAPTGNNDELERRAKELLRTGTLIEPIGIRQPLRSRSVQQNFVRDPRVVAWVLSEAKGHCEACGAPAPFNKDDGTPFLEVHHVKELADGGSDRVSNAVAICPNCHRRCHHSADRGIFVASIYERVKRLVPESNERRPFTL